MYLTFYMYTGTNLPSCRYREEYRYFIKLLHNLLLLVLKLIYRLLRRGDERD